MRRALELGHTPRPALPLAFLLLAPWFGAAAGILLAWHGGEALASRWNGVTFAIVHLITLGFLSMTMAGSLLQMLPVVAGLPLRGQMLGRLSCPLLAIGTCLLAAAFVRGAAPLFAAAAGTLAAAFALLLACLLSSLWQRGDGNMAAVAGIVRGMRMSVSMLAATVCAGLALAGWLAGGPAVPVLALTDTHAALGMVGWVTLLTVAVSFQVVPMFQGTSPYPRLLTRCLAPTLALTLLAWAAGRWLDAAWRVWGALAATATACAWIAPSWRLLDHRRHTPDPTTLHWRLALLSLASALGGFARPFPGGDRATLFIGVAFLGGFAMTLVGAMLYKIVPFLLWYHMRERASPGTPVPRIADMVAPGWMRAQFRCHAAAVGLAMLGCWVPVLVRPAGVLLAADCVLLGSSLTAPLLRHRRLMLGQPS